MKQPLVTMIVPTRNSAEFLGACLQSIKDQTYKNIELIVVDNNSTDDTKKIARKYTPHVFNKGPERSAQRNYGAKKASGVYFLFIDSDMELTPKVVEECVEKITSNKDVKALVIPEESFGEGFWAKCKALERSFYQGVDWMEGARFFDSTAFQKLHGYDEENTGTEDYDLPQKLIHITGSKSSIDRISSLIRHNEKTLSILELCKRKFYYARKLRIYRDKPFNEGRYRAQSSLFKRYKLFFSKPLLLFSDPLTGLGMLFMKAAEFLAGGLGYLLKRNAE